MPATGVYHTTKVSVCHARRPVPGGEWKYVNVRRPVLHVEKSIDHGTQWAVFEPNGEPLSAAPACHGR
jgi:Bacteriophage tail sheath protein